MPIYEFMCENCGFQDEKLQKIGEETPQCPKCGVGLIKKLTYPALVKVKGTGGYLVRSKGYKEGYSREYLKDNPPEAQG